MPRISEITIIGSGIIGLLTAKELIDTGCSVTLIDKSCTGQESSWAGGGILLPLYPWRQAESISTLVIESIRHYPVLAEELLSSTGIDPEWYDCGILICKNPDVIKAKKWCSQYDISCLDADINQFEQLNTRFIQPLWLPTIAQARNPRLLKSLKAYLLNAGATLLENCEVIDCAINNDTINYLTTTQGKLPVNQVIISTGAWTRQLSQKLLPSHLLTPNISPVKGQMLLYDALPDTLPHMILDNDRYLIPRKDGKILAGSSVEHMKFDKSTSHHIKTKLNTFATELFPALKKYPVIHHWAGLRPGTNQGIPYIGRHPVIKNLNVNAGHFRNGLTMAPASARLMTDLILNRQPDIDPSPYSLSASAISESLPTQICSTG